MGRFQQLRNFHLQHARLCPYIDAIKGKHNQVFLVCQTYTWSIRDIVKQSQIHFSEEQIRSILFQILDALVFLNSRQIVHRKLSLDNIMVDERGMVKLSDYGMYHMTKSGSLVAFPIGDPRYLSPEAIAEGIVFSEVPDTTKSDTWSLGIILFELISGGQLPWPQTSNTPFKVLLETLNLIGHEIHIDLQNAKLQDLESSDLEALRIKESGILSTVTKSFSSPMTPSNSSTTPGKPSQQRIVPNSPSKMSVDSRQQQHTALQQKSTSQLELLINSTPQFARVSQELRNILLLCLTVDPMTRCTPAELISHPYFAGLLQSTHDHCWVPKPFTMSDILSMDPYHPIRQYFAQKLAKTERHRKEELEKATSIKPLPHSSSASSSSSTSSHTSLATHPHSSSENSGTQPATSTSITGGLAATLTFGLFGNAPTSSNTDSATSASQKEAYDPLQDPVNNITLAELFHIWCQGSGGDIEGELAPELKISPPILRIPLFVKSKENAAEMVSDPNSRLITLQHGTKDESRRYNDQMVKISLETLAYLAERNSNFSKMQFLNVDRSHWPLEVREKDLEYQAHRICMFRQLLEHYPETRNQIVREARKDIPPMLRAEIWAAILNVPSADVCTKTYADIDKESEGPADRQIELDVPRCHQYHELLSSPEGHYKLKRVLKAWVKFNPNWGYWQGVDSFLAPFLVQNFNNEPMAFWCLQRAVEKFSRNLFDREQSVYLQEHLQIFKQLLSYHDPKLSMHLHEIGFQPALYAIPWFLTLFTQFFSLDQIARLWDRVLLSSSQLPFYLAFSMMRQLREIILPLDFNACILLFSSLPGVDIEAFIKEAKLVAQETPSSITEANYKHSTSAKTSSEQGDKEHGLPPPPKFNPSQQRIDRWWEKQVPIEELQTELFPRLSVVDLVSASNFRFTILDLRYRDSFDKTSLPGSINVDASPQALGSVTMQAEIARRLDQHRGSHFVVVGDRTHPGREFANFLVENGVPRVSLLNGGIEALLADVPTLLTRSGLPPLIPL